MPAVSPLKALVQILSSAVDELESRYAEKGAEYPSLDAPFSPDTLEHDPEVMQIRCQILGAAYQLMMTAGTPMENHVTTYTCGLYMASAIQYVVETSIADVLKEGDPKGLHVDEIAKKINAPNSQLTARILRYMASRHCFKEVAPNIFAHNRMSSILVKTKSLAEIQSNPLTQYDGMTASAVVGYFVDEGLKSAAHLAEWLQDSSLGPHAFGVAFKAPDMWQWFEQPGNELRRKRFATVMTGLAASNYPQRIFNTAINWGSLPENSVVVDVGGSTGSVALGISKEFSHLKYVIQDLPQVIDTMTKKFWQEHSPDFVAQGKVEFQAHDFFTPNPVKGAEVYFMRTITHDWSQDKNIEILKHLRAAAKPSSKLILFDYIILYACPDPTIPADKAPKAPYPMLPNLGYGLGGTLTAMDLHMLSMFNGQERTVAEFKDLGDKSGWTLETAIPGPIGTVVYTAT